MLAKACTLFLMLCATVSSFGQNNVIDEVVWVVGDEAILKSDVESERLNAQYQGRKFDGDPYSVIPEQLAIQKLFLNQAVIDSVMVSDQEVFFHLFLRSKLVNEPVCSLFNTVEYFLI